MTALILVDLQNDFMPGGALAVREGDKVLPIVNTLLSFPFDLIIATKDYHPKGHVSFASTHKRKVGDHVECDGNIQLLWPDHCVQGTNGAEFHKNFNYHKVNVIIEKGIEKNVDSYSTFFDNQNKRSTGLEAILKEKKIHTLYLAGLATDYCVKYSALDGLRLKFKVYVVKEGCRGVNLRPFDADHAFEEMAHAGAHIVSIGDVKKNLGVLPVASSTIFKSKRSTQTLLYPEYGY